MFGNELSKHIIGWVLTETPADEIYSNFSFPYIDLGRFFWYGEQIDVCTRVFSGQRRGSLTRGLSRGTILKFFEMFFFAFGPQLVKHVRE